MEILFNSILDNLIYRANIFNYDNALLKEIMTKTLKLDLNAYFEEYQQGSEITATLQFLKQKSKDQIAQLIALLSQKKEDANPLAMEKPIEVQEVRVKNISREARVTLLLLLKVIIDSKEKFDEAESKKIEDGENLAIDEYQSNIAVRTLHGENLLCCLLYLDGISMVNIDLTKKLSELSILSGKGLTDLLFEILHDKWLDPIVKEIASHLLSLDLMNYEDAPVDKCEELMEWTFNYFAERKRENCLTSNLALVLTYDSCVDLFINQFESINRCIELIFDLMIKESNFNTIYESLFCVWNISNTKANLSIFENKNAKYLEKIVQVIKTNKIDKIARIGLMIIMNLLDSQTCVEILFDIKFMRTIDILLTNKWNDSIIRDHLNYIYDYLEKNYKIMNSFEKYAKELESGNLKQGSLHTTPFWEDNYKEFEYNNFAYINMLVSILKNPNIDQDIEMKCIACFDLGEFARLYPGGASILEHFGAKDHLLLLIQHNNLELKNRALVCLQKIMMRSLKK